MGQTVGWALNVTEYVFPPVRPSYDETHDFLVHFPSGAEADIPAMLVPPLPGTTGWKRGKDASAGSTVSVCVIFFHPNACDIGDCITDMAAIRDGVFRGDAIVLAPEYCGYGLLSTYQPSVESVDLVATAAWRYCRKTLGFRGEQIVLWGRSIGTGPAASVAEWRGRRAREKGRRVNRSRPLGALVLLAPFTSISNVVYSHTNMILASLVSPMWEVAELVKEPGLEDVPLCVVHPREDEVVPLAHGQAVLEAGSSNFKNCLWLSDKNHNFNLEVEHLHILRGYLSDHLGRERRRASWNAKGAGDAFFPDLSNSNMLGASAAQRHTYDGSQPNSTRPSDLVAPARLVKQKALLEQMNDNQLHVMGGTSASSSGYPLGKGSTEPLAPPRNKTDGMRSREASKEVLAEMKSREVSREVSREASLAAPFGGSLKEVDERSRHLRSKTKPQDTKGGDRRTRLSWVDAPGDKPMDLRPHFPVPVEMKSYGNSADSD